MILQYDLALDKLVLANPAHVASIPSTLTTTTLANNTTRTVPHGQGVPPRNFVYALIVVSPVAGWGIGEVIYRWIDGVTGVSDTTIQVGADATNFIVGIGAQNVVISNKTTGGVSSASVSNFAMVFYLL